MKPVGPLILVLFTITACNSLPFSHALVQLDKYGYQETQCADPWGGGGSVLDCEGLEEEVATYLEDHDIGVVKLKVNGDLSAEACGGCICETGREVVVYVVEGQASAIEALGFEAM